jgi:guanylate kinase
VLHDVVRGRLVVLAGPSGVGKSSVVGALRERLPGLFFSVSATTRDPRPGEVDGVHYEFVGDARFDEMIDHGELLEWAEIHGGLQRSGTPRRPVEDALADGRPVLVEVDLQGARTIKAVMPEAISVFLAPPSFEELARRLQGRGTESEAQFRRRLETAREELGAQDEFDVVVVNEDLQKVVTQLVDLLVGADGGICPPSTPRTSADRLRRAAVPPGLRPDARTSPQESSS